MKWYMQMPGFYICSAITVSTSLFTLKIFLLQSFYHYIYICVCVCVFVCGCTRVCVWVVGQHFFIKIYLVTLHRQLLSTYSYCDPFKLPYGCRNIRPELVNKFFKIDLFPSSSSPIICHLQWSVYITKVTQTLQVQYNFVSAKCFIYTDEIL